MTDKDNIWVEKYRPKTLEDIVGHDDVVRAIKNKLSAGSLQSILLYGPAGTGKTSLARVIAREIYGPEGHKYMLDLNASDENGIDVIRSKVKNRAMSKAFDDKPRVILLDEIDSMTPQAQAALRRIMEDAGMNTIFILATNDLNSVILPLQSRCKGSTYEVGRLQDLEILMLITKILKAEGKLEKIEELSEKGREIVKRCDGDARAAVDFIQSWCQGEEIKVVNTKSRFISLMKELQTATEPADLLKFIKPEELGEFSRFVINSRAQSPELRMILSEILAETDFRMQKSHNKDIQLVWMLIQIMKEVR